MKLFRQIRHFCLVTTVVFCGWSNSVEAELNCYTYEMLNMYSDITMGKRMASTLSEAEKYCFSKFIQGPLLTEQDTTNSCQSARVNIKKKSEDLKPVIEQLYFCIDRHDASRDCKNEMHAVETLFGGYSRTMLKLREYCGE